MATVFTCYRQEVFAYFIEKMRGHAPGAKFCYASSLRDFYFDNDDVFITINGAGLRYMPSGAKIVCLVNDHPRYIVKALSSDTHKRLQVIVLDENHGLFIRRYAPGIKNIYFMPNGGWEELAPNEKTMDVVYFGNCQPKWRDFAVIPFLPGKGEAFVKECIDVLYAEPWRTTEDVIHEIGAALSHDRLFDIQTGSAPSVIEATVRRRYKLKTMRALDRAGIKVYVWGNYWEDGKNSSLHDRVSSAECNRLAKQAKIALNFNPWYKNGASERVFNNMLAGAVCATDENDYLKKRFYDGRDCIFFDLRHPERLAERITDLLKNPREMEEIARAGYETASNHDTWKHRWIQIAEIINKT